MAKINRNGDTVRLTWDGPNGRKMVLTAHGRLLMRYGGQSHYTVLRHHASVETAKRLAAANLLMPQKEI